MSNPGVTKSGVKGTAVKPTKTHTPPKIVPAGWKPTSGKATTPIFK